tara:strand:- start:1562 stop:2044 length:483 start_codon:yes stop_codon:yes gene_type:complete
MNPGIGMPEMFVVLVLALVVVGPQQLPVMMRKLGRMMAQARSMAKDFQGSFEELGRESELADLRKEINALKEGNPIQEIGDELAKARHEATHDDIRAMKIANAAKEGYVPGRYEGGPEQSKPGVSSSKTAASPKTQPKPETKPEPQADDTDAPRRPADDE